MSKTILLFTDSDSGATDKSFEYLLGFQPSLGALLLSDERINIFLDPRYFSKTKDIDTKLLRQRLGNKGIEVNYIEVKSGYIDAVCGNLEGVKELEIHEVVSMKIYDQVKEKLGKDCKIVTCEDPLISKRLIKDETEVQNMKKAIEIIDGVCEHIFELNKKGELIGMSELQVRGIIISKIFEQGGSGESFESVVAFGENSACPHHYAGETVISEGVLLIDMGALYKGYCSDFTRTFWVTNETGEVSSEGLKQQKKFEEVYRIVKKAHEKAYMHTVAGTKVSDIDTFARNVISEAGYGDKFIHATGHGIGLDVHEKPHVTKKSEEVIMNNSFFTIEPGIYLEGEFGIRIEDIVYVDNGKVIKYTKCML